ncbi:MAG: extracellular solute-binding protein [Deltaproteobacteria bacterium]|nr:extracellular solute-binding protein [Deltaproteobacteria bacterium]
MKRKKNHDVSRRTFLKGLGAAGAAAAAGIGFPSVILGKAEVDRSKLAKSISFSSYGGSWQENLTKAVLDPFTKEYGVEILQSSHGGEEEILAKIRAGGAGAYDLITINESGFYPGVLQGLFEPLDLENIPNFTNMMKPLQKPIYDPGIKMDGRIRSVSSVFGTTALTYNTEKVEPKPDSWAPCWDKKYAKKISMNEMAWYRVFTTALYLGQDPNNITDYDALWDAVRQQHKLVLKYWSSGMEMQQLFTNREIYLGEFWSGRTLNLKLQGVPVEYVIPKEGASTWVEAWCIPKGSKKKYTVEVLMNFMLKPEIAARMSELTKYPCSLDPSKYKVTETIRSLPDFDPTGTLQKYKFVDYAYKEKHNAEWTEKFNEIKMGG